jgi:cytochrome c-type biogenesis protein CcmH
MIRVLLFSIALFFAVLAPAYALRPDEVLPDPTLETRARAISSELRCMVCQNQSIDDSDAPLARDLRILVRERLKAGDSDNSVRAFLTTRYGDFILLKPPLKPETVMLWLGPGVLLLAGVAIILLRRPRRGIAGSGDTELSAEERAALSSLVGEGQIPDRSAR